MKTKSVIFFLLLCALLTQSGCTTGDQESTAIGDRFIGLNAPPSIKSELISFLEDVGKVTTPGQIQGWAQEQLESMPQDIITVHVPPADWPDWIKEIARMSDTRDNEDGAELESLRGLRFWTGGVGIVVRLDRVPSEGLSLTVMIDGNEGLKGLAVGSESFEPSIRGTGGIIYLEWIPGVYGVYTFY